ncbi:U26 [Drosophila busckii]|uniref:U26 n=1 Tax=Drosophila busckii TaxID=30019 RepID=A0A0M4E7Z6_DROBS|nr:U26 [Drosophila busckii]
MGSDLGINTKLETLIKVDDDFNIEPNAVEELKKLYDIERLREFGDIPFLIKRMEPHDFAISYRNAISSAQIIVQLFRKNQVPRSTGIALRLGNHTPSSCTLILAILNHNCYFYCNDKMILSKALHCQMCDAGIDYLIVNSYMAVGSSFFIELDSFIVYNEEYKLYKLKYSENNVGKATNTVLPPNMCYIITTTGTTGVPKLIYVPYECIAPNIVALSVTTPGITVMQMTPSLFRQFGATAIRERILHSSSTLRVLLLGGEAFPSNAELVTWMEPQVLQQKLVCNIYGITEMSCWATMHVLDSLHSLVPLGTPIDDQTVLHIGPPTNETLNKSKLHSGELWLGSATRRCYIPEDDNDSISDQVCFRLTGDLVRQHNHSVVYEGRSNNVVKRAGQRINLELITRRIEDCLQIGELVCCLWQEELQKLICCIRSLELKTKTQQRAQTFNILSKLLVCQQPDRFVYLQHFPCNAHGKLDKFSLLNLCTPMVQPAQDILISFLHDRLECVDSPTHNMQKRRRMDQPIRQPNPTGYDLSFRQAGGTSFHAITLCREIGLQMCIDDEQRHLFELLLDENIPLRSILSYLDSVKLVAHNTKLKSVQPVISSGGSGLIITRVEPPALNFQFHWRVCFKKCIDSPVAQYESRYVCVGAHSKILRTLDAQTGQEISTIKLTDRIECKVTFISENLAMVGCYDGTLYGFNPLTGNLIWSVGIGGMIKAQPHMSLDRSRILVCSYADDYNVICLSMNRQEVLWCIRLGEKGIFASPFELPQEQAVIICTLDGSYYRISILDGAVQWKQKCSEPFFSTPVFLGSSENLFLCAEVTGRVHACSLITGDIQASYSVEGNIFSSLVVKAPPTHMGYSFVLFGSIDQHIYCLRCKTGSGQIPSFELHWKLNVGAPVYATPSIVTIEPNGHFVFCSATNGSLLLADFNGQTLWTDKLGGEVFSTPCFIQSLKRIYLGCRDNHLYCLSI